MLLGDQRLQVLGPRPVLDDARDLSNAMADAAGIALLPETPTAADNWFAGMPTLLRIVEDCEDDLASDLRRFWQVDYADRFTGGLSLRRIWTYIRRLPPTSAIALASNAGRHIWTETDYILAGIYQALTGQVYPGRPLKPEEVTKAIEAVQAQAEHAARLRQREAEYASPPANPVVAAMTEAEENRRRQLGL